MSYSLSNCGEKHFHPAALISTAYEPKSKDARPLSSENDPVLSLF